MMIGVYNHLLSKVFRFHYHSQKVIGSLGIVDGWQFLFFNLNTPPKFNIAPEKWRLEDDPFLLGETVTFQGRAVKLLGCIFLQMSLQLFVQS